MARSLSSWSGFGDVRTAYPARMESRRPSESISILTRWMGVMDANTAGNVHGGVILRLCDEAAGLAAGRHSRGRVVTAGMDRMTFASPVYIGQLVTCRAMVNAAWRTSVEVGVRVESGEGRVGGGGGGGGGAGGGGGGGGCPPLGGGGFFGGWSPWTVRGSRHPCPV